MKTISSLFLVIFFTTNTFAQLPNYLPTDSLVGWWPFNGNTNDESGNGYNAIPQGPILSNDRSGMPNSAYWFDGIDDFMMLEKSFNDWEEFSISVWVNHYKGSNFSGIISDATNYSGKDLYFNMNDNQIGLKADKGNNFLFRSPLPDIGYNVSPVVENLSLQLKWHHLVLTVSNTCTKVYLNSILIKTLHIGGSNVNHHAVHPVFGKITDGDYNIQFFKGFLDDIGIWNKVLNENEINSLYYNTVNTNSLLENNTIMNRTLIKITDINGKIITRKKNTLMLFVYSDGTVEKIIEIDN